MAAQVLPKSDSKLLSVNFAKGPRGYESLGSGVYCDRRSGKFYWRPFEAGKRTYRLLDSKTIRFAKIEAGKLYCELALSKRGLAENPLAKGNSVKDILDFYVREGCPGRQTGEVSTKALTSELRNIETIKKWPAVKREATKITLEVCGEYHEWRRSNLKRNTSGTRQIDLEITTLSKAFRCATRNAIKTGIRVNPLAADRPVFHDPKLVKHCRDFQPASGEELHAIARMLFQPPRSEVLAWQLLLEAMIGQRTHEILKLRRDAKNEDEPGFIRGQHLFLYRSKTSKGTYPFIQIHAALAECLEAMANWAKTRRPKSPWYFPNNVDHDRALDPCSLSHALARVTAAMGIPHRTSHGLRSFYVNVLRSQGKSDAEIGLRIGHRSGVRLIIDVYGEILPYRLSWLPAEGPPAWAQWLPGAGKEFAVQREFDF